MPPKKKKSAIVVGTVSTRSTRRESVVNIQIVPKAVKTVKTPSRKSLRNTYKTTENNENDNTSSKKTSPEILEILKDWSDEETGDEKIISNRLEQGDSDSQVALNQSNILSGDQQSLIDILEGNQSEIAAPVPQNAVIDPIVTMNSPDHTEVIEECVVEDDGIILELADDQIKLTIDPVAEVKDNLGDTDKKEENKIEYIYSDSSNINEDNFCTFSIHMTDDDNKSVSSEDTSHSVVLIKDDNDIEITFKNCVNKNSREKVPHKINDSLTVSNRNELEHLKSNISDTKHIGDVEEVVEESVISESFEIIQTEVPEEETDNLPNKEAVLEPTSRKSEGISIKGDSVDKNVQLNDKSTLNTNTFHISQGVEALLCQKISETMKICKETTGEGGLDIISEKLGGTMEKMHIHDKIEEIDNQQSTVENKDISKKENSQQNKVDTVKTPTRTKAQRKSFESSAKPTRKSTRNKNVNQTVPEAQTDTKKVEGNKPVGININCDKSDTTKKSPAAALTECDIIKKKFEEVQNKKNKIIKSKPKKNIKKTQEMETKLDRSANQMDVIETELDNITNQVEEELKSSVEKNKLKKPFKNTGFEDMEVDSETEVSNKVSLTCSAKSDSEMNLEQTKIKRNHKKYLPTKDSKSIPYKEMKKKGITPKKGLKLETSEEVRRSDRIKTIVPIKKRSHGLVKSKSESSLLFDAESSDTNSVHSEFEKYTPTPQLTKKEKSKSRSKSMENVSLSNSNSPQSESYPPIPKADGVKTDESGQAEIEARLKTFIHLKDNQYKTDRQICKEAQEMVCDCYLAEEDIQKNEFGCGEDCLNRLLLIECGVFCQVGERCTNKRFQKTQFAPVEVFKTEKKGLGLRAAANIPYGEFILEYVGEVLNPDEFDKRAEVYSKDKNIHFYFMSLRSDAIIDATMRGNISRFINHSCDPNAETQKWTVNGELRIGFFSTRTILAGEEITFDYRFQRYGKEAQKCYCEAATCRGWLGERPEESEDEEEEEDEEDTSKQLLAERPKSTLVVPNESEMDSQTTLEKTTTETGIKIEAASESKKDISGVILETPKKSPRKKPRKEILYEDFDQLNEDIEMLVTTGLKNQAHTLKLSRLMVRAKDLEQRKKLLRVLRRGELPCRRLFLDYHGLRLMHGYMIDAQQITSDEKSSPSSDIGLLQTKLELLQTLAVLPIQNKTMLIESKVLPAVEKWSKNEDLIEEKPPERTKEKHHPLPHEIEASAIEKIDEIKFLANKLLEEWSNLKEVFRIPKKQRIEQMKEHEKEANRKFMASTYAQEQESSRKNDQRYRTWSRYKSERETNKKGMKLEDKDKPSAAYLRISKHERRKLFALQMELKEEERRLKQREMWRQHELNCLMIGADPRFTAPFDPNKGFQYIWNPSIGQWQALPVPSLQNQGVYNSPVTPTPGVGGFNIPPAHKPNFITTYPPPAINVQGLPGTNPPYPGLQTNIPPPMVPGLAGSVPGLPGAVPGLPGAVPGLPGAVPGLSGSVPGHPATVPTLTPTVPGLAPTVPGITQPPLPSLPIYQEIKKEEDPSQVKFAGPIPPPVKLPPKWKTAKDKYGRPYYYHVKVRKSQWEPPPLPETVDESSDTTSSDTSTLSSSDSSSDSDTDNEMDDTKLLMEVRKQMDKTPKLKSVIPERLKHEEKDSVTPSPEIKPDSDEGTPEDQPKEADEDNTEQLSSIDLRLKEQFNLDDNNDPPKKKRRVGLCEEIIISPRTKEDRLQFKEDMKRFRATKEKLKRQKEQMLHQVKKKTKVTLSEEDVKKIKEKRHTKTTVKSRIKEMNDWNNEHAKKIKEVFRSNMATTVVSVLNAYRKPDCKDGRITNTEDFKHLARKLTHFVMLKEMKHIEKIEDLQCTDNVKAKAREYIRKYMSKFGEVYQKRQDEPDFKD